MLSVTDRALQMVVGETFTTPVELIDRILPELHQFACRVTGLPNLRRTFALNALVPVDNAAWLLYAEENGIRSFDEMIPDEYRPGLSYRQKSIAVLPSVTYGLPIEDVVRATQDGYFVIKVKLGSPAATQAEMLEKDIARLTAIHQALAGARTTQTSDGKIRYDLDPNQRYEKKEMLLRLLDAAKKIGALEQVAFLEEPFADENDADLHDVPRPDRGGRERDAVGDATRRVQQGYAGFALKGIAKTLSETLKIAKLAHEQRLVCMAADLTVNPVLVDWNKNVAAGCRPSRAYSWGMLRDERPPAVPPLERDGELASVRRRALAQGGAGGLRARRRLLCAERVHLRGAVALPRRGVSDARQLEPVLHRAPDSKAANCSRKSSGSLRGHSELSKCPSRLRRLGSRRSVALVGLSSGWPLSTLVGAGRAEMHASTHRCRPGIPKEHTCQPDAKS